MTGMESPPQSLREVHDAITKAAAVNNTDDARTLAFVAIRDGENWNDRRLPEVGRALNAALDAIEGLLRLVAAHREEYLLTYAEYLGGTADEAQAALDDFEREALDSDE